MFDVSTMPEFEMKNFARWVARATEKYFEDPKVQKEFKEWLKEKKKTNETEESNKAYEGTEDIY